ncbi:putative baseplate protein [Pseudomonas phage phiK7A1]|uniref:Putative baseplate protein n=1 Tax=Pseudomonas phage phiK7A1 TaxID=2759194 RepID=A0A7H0XFT2_9CAUD|nr:putative baseplate protein [Pseudomonas phage phiK7A1]
MREHSLHDTMQTHFNIRMAELNTAIPCVVTNVVGELANQRIDVQPAINLLYKDGTSEERPQILGVPVMFPGSNTSLISWPINVGDTVMCVFSQRSMDNFKIGNGQPTVPNDYRKMAAQDAVAFPGLQPFAKSLNNPAIRLFPHSTRDLVISHNVGTASEVEIRFKENGDMIVNTKFNVNVNAKTATVTALEKITLAAPLMEVNVTQTNWTGNITHTGNYTQTGTSTFNGIVFDTHKHLGVTPGSGTSGVATS